MSPRDHLGRCPNECLPLADRRSDVHVPFGGIKGSGVGPHEQERAALECYTDTVTIYVDP